jgi:small subunit ribosomal protein S6
MRVIPNLQYECLFLFPQSVNVNLKDTVEFIRETLTKNGATVISLKKWGDRLLAYPIKKQKRGVYILCYFTAPTNKISDIDRTFNLSENLLRHMITNVQHLSMDEIKAVDGQLDLMIEANLRAPVTEVEPVAVPVVPEPMGDDR